MPRGVLCCDQKLPRLNGLLSGVTVRACFSRIRAETLSSGRNTIEQSHPQLLSEGNARKESV